MNTYKYQNGTIHITKPTEEQCINIQKHTEIFLRKVVKEEIQNGNNNTSGAIEEKPLLVKQS